MIFIAVIGGIGTIEGPIVGTIVFFLLRETLSELGTTYLLILGAVAIAVMLKAPKGLWGIISEKTGVALVPIRLASCTKNSKRRSPSGKEREHGRRPVEESHHQLRHHGRHPHADDVRGTAGHAGRHREPGDRCGRGRAAILHLHARDPLDGRPTPDPAVFMQFLPRIKQATDAVINITTGGGLNMTVDQRFAAPLQAKPESVAQHGLDEFRHLPARRPLFVLESRLGRVVSARHRRLHLPQHVQRHRTNPQTLREAHGTSFEDNATTSATSTTSRISSTAASSSRLFSSR